MTASSADREQRALASIDERRIVDDTCELIRGRGENPGETEAETVHRLRAICERIGARVVTQEFEPGRENLRAVLGPESGPSVLFLGHSDVVPAGEGWSADPFEPRVHDGLIIGRGTTDMKGGLAAVLAAMEAVHRVSPELRLELLCTGDEEDRAQGVLAALGAAEALAPGAADAPPTGAPREYLACIVAEPTDLDVVIGCRGASNFVIECLGASAHAGRPSDGASSIYAASRVVELVRREHLAGLEGDHDPLLGGPTWSVGTIAGGSGTSMVPRQTYLTVDRRTMPGEDPRVILAGLLGKVRADIATGDIPSADRIEVFGEVNMEMPGFRTAPGSPVVTTAAAAVAELGRAGRVTGWTAACEGGFIAGFHNVPTIILGPGDINNQAHQPDEHVRIDHLVLAARAYALTVLRLAASANGRAGGTEEQEQS
ncbi:M20/M25/M40 family metallo-hydrolase [Leucobacter sp. gxy201]|uniref:M20 family metallopeptidase n=1 Tax=Leucobacter sp. gxy201 TaxID=2957200 RepID=UPI003DA14DEA